MKSHPRKKLVIAALALAAIALVAGVVAFARPAVADEAMALANSKIVVALDPGHGGGDSGAVGNGLQEKNLTWKISTYTKEWLEARGVKVFITHNGTEHGANGESTPSRRDRSERAYEHGACVVVSQHINSADATSARGFEMWAPNSRSGYHASTIDAANKLWTSLRPKLEDLGLANRGKKTSTWGTYPDGSPADELGMVYYPRLSGMTGVIIEHAFISNADDAALLADDAFLQKLGVADAEAIYENLDTFYRAYCENQADPEAIAAIRNAADHSVFRLYNQWTGDHLSTLDKDEAVRCVGDGWTYEGVKWVSPTSGSTSIWRIYNPYSGDHYYTADHGEAEQRVSEGWRWDCDGNPAFYGASESDPAACKVYKLFNPYVEVGTHLFTTDDADDGERATCLGNGWEEGDVAFYGLTPGSAPSEDPVEPPAPTGTPIMGASTTTKDALASRFDYLMNYYGKAYPAIYAEKGAANPREFVNVLWDEAMSEGVRPEVLLAQVIKETGWLQFGGMVRAEQCNFGGIGALDNSHGESVATFSSVAEGLLAQSQHLKAYASTDPLNRDCVDPRFSLVTRGCAPTVEELGGKWATGANYGVEIVELMETYGLS